jgi:hypothetical protein
VVIVQHYAHSAKHYAEALPFPGCLFALPDRCPHPDCRAVDALIRWGTYERQALTGLQVFASVCSASAARPAGARITCSPTSCIRIDTT